jgi:hypothetical protein
MKIHEMLGHMGGGKGFPSWLNMGCAMIPSKIDEQCLHERHMEESMLWTTLSIFMLRLPIFHHELGAKTCRACLSHLLART